MRLAFSATLGMKLLLSALKVSSLICVAMFKSSSSVRSPMAISCASSKLRLGDVWHHKFAFGNDVFTFRADLLAEGFESHFIIVFGFE